MKEWIGLLQRIELGTGGWELVLPDGSRYELYGDVPEALGGRQVKVRGEVREVHGFLMTGASAVDVISVEASQ